MIAERTLEAFDDRLVEIYYQKHIKSFYELKENERKELIIELVLTDHILTNDHAEYHRLLFILNSGEIGIRSFSDIIDDRYLQIRKFHDFMKKVLTDNQLGYRNLGD